MVHEHQTLEHSLQNTSAACLLAQWKLWEHLWEMMLLESNELQCSLNKTERAVVY